MIVEWNFWSCFKTPVNLFINQPNHSGLDKSLYFGAHTCVYFKELWCTYGYRQFVFEAVSSDQSLFVILLSISIEFAFVTNRIYLKNFCQLFVYTLKISGRMS